MGKLLIIISFLILINTSYSLPSDDIWIKIRKYSKENRTITDIGGHYLFFDESDYTQMAGNKTRKEALTSKLSQIFKDYDINTYIFLVDNIDERIEHIENVAFHLEDYLRMRYDIYSSKSIIAVFSIETRRFSIITGRFVRKYILGYWEIYFMVGDIRQSLQNKQYYEFTSKFLENVLYYCHKHNVLFYATLIFSFSMFAALVLFAIFHR